MKKRAFAIAAHPDDIEFVMSGTLILLKKSGYEVHYMNIANGSCGTVKDDIETIIKIRREEAINAAGLIDAVYHESLVNDIEIFYEKKLLAGICSIIRKVAPDILLVHSPRDYMEDHMNACRLAVSAAFCRNIRNFSVEPPQEPVNHKVVIYHAQPFGNTDDLGRTVKPDLYVDITDVIDTKVAMLAEHKSQKEWLDKSQGIDSYLETLRELARQVGSMSGQFEYAEGWRRHNYLGFGEKGFDPLYKALKEKVVISGDK